VSSLLLSCTIPVEVNMKRGRLVVKVESRMVHDLVSDVRQVILHYR
jgi:hypothetical protein